MVSSAFLLQAEDGIRYLVRSRGLGDVYKRQAEASSGGADRSLKSHTTTSAEISVARSSRTSL